MSSLGLVVGYTDRYSVFATWLADKCDTFQHAWQHLVSNITNRINTHRLLWSSHSQNAQLDHQHIILRQEFFKGDP